MKADSLSATDLFGGNRRYVIPEFQRPYVWKLEEQWEPFWEDVQYAAERFLEEVDPNDFEGSMVTAEQSAGRHFMGAVVLKQVLTGAIGIETHEVIDGQQRLTTMQLLMDAVEEVAEAEGWEELAEDLDALVRNKGQKARRDPDLRFKVWPTPQDRDAFRAAMTNGASTEEFKDSRVVLAHDYFQTRVRDWVDQAEGELEHRLVALQIAILGLLELIVIDLSENDDPFVIFETLNARGTPLLASDLVKNLLLQRADAAGLDMEKFASEYWGQFSAEYWQKEIRQGRLRRPRVDVLLDYWLEAETVEEVASHQIYPTFKKLLEERGAVEPVAQAIRDHAAVYKQIETFPLGSREELFYYRWDEIDARTLTPLLLWLYSLEESDLGRERRTRCLVALESYLVRRMVNRMTTKGYNRFFLDTLDRLKEEPSDTADDVLIGHLAAQSADSTEWPSDATFREAFLDRPVYTLLARKRVRLVLEALEDDIRTPKSEDEHVLRRKLEIEHVMPQSWQMHWPLSADKPELEADLDRKRLIQTFGNLTLASSSLNKTMSNHPWEAKRKHLDENSTLLMNGRILRMSEEHGGWDESMIKARSGELADRAIAIWPRG